jgi:hypothetical protein
LFSGTPRILPFIADALVNSHSGYPGLSLLAGGAVRYFLISRPDIKSKALIWQENSFIGPQDPVPGLKQINLRMLETVPGQKLVLSRIKLQLPIHFDTFELKLLEQVRDIFFESNPEELTVGKDGNVEMPTILERRLHIGCHNSHQFLGDPLVINLIADVHLL